MTLTSSVSINARTTKSNTVTVTDNKQTAKADSKSETSMPVPSAPSTKTVPHEAPEEKAHAPKTEELPHIHHFHKERVKKVKRHHKKCWVLSMFLVVLCHAALLVMAYMHVTH